MGIYIRLEQCDSMLNERDYTMHNIPTNQSDLRDKFTVYVKFRLTSRVRCFSVFHVTYAYHLS